MLHVITGASCSGKTTYANAHKEPSDVIVDLDAITAVLGGKYHGKNDLTREIARAARNAAIDAAIAKGVTAWVIHSQPSGEYMRFYARQGARFHELDPGIETCKKRARESQRPSWTIAAIDSWYARKQKQSTGTAKASRNW